MWHRCCTVRQKRRSAAKMTRGVTAWRPGSSSWLCRRTKPVFGICRGLQILNVVLGGTLYQDLKTQTGTEITHSMDKPYDRTVHEVNILPDTPLAALYGPGPLAVNSRHHQGIKGLAPALHAQAVASDGLVEAVYLPEYRFVQAVQWHPEHRWQAAESQSLLRSFVDACRG